MIKEGWRIQVLLLVAQRLPLEDLFQYMDV